MRVFESFSTKIKIPILNKHELKEKKKKKKKTLTDSRSSRMVQISSEELTTNGNRRESVTVRGLLATVHRQLFKASLVRTRRSVAVDLETESGHIGDDEWRRFNSSLATVNGDGEWQRFISDDEWRRFNGNASSARLQKQRFDGNASMANGFLFFCLGFSLFLFEFQHFNGFLGECFFFFFFFAEWVNVFCFLFGSIYNGI